MTFGLSDIAENVVAVEKDRRIFRVMCRLTDGHDNIRMLKGDILETRFSDIFRQMPFTVYGNIPYNITTPIIKKLIDQREHIDVAYLVIQKEVAERITAQPGSKKIGSLTFYIRYFAEASILSVIKKNSFYPRPEVDSALLKLRFRARPPVAVSDEKLMFSVIRAAFSQRRKKAINSVVSAGNFGLDRIFYENIFREMDLDAKIRAECMTLTEFALLTEKIVSSIEHP
jgi:16S rRNA (adenine1518-N6/adenine1519-N6)-dimethyltransferase